MAFSRFIIDVKDISVIGVLNKIILLELRPVLQQTEFCNKTQIYDDCFIRTAWFLFCCVVMTNPSSAMICPNLNPLGIHHEVSILHLVTLRRRPYNGAVRFPVSRFPVTINSDWATTTMQNTLHIPLPAPLTKSNHPIPTVEPLSSLSQFSSSPYYTRAPTYAHATPPFFPFFTPSFSLLH